jgi:hypothetical protein
MPRYASILLLSFTSTVFLAGCHRNDRGGNEPAFTKFDSPTAVFDAYRRADRNEEWRTLYFLFSPEVQRDVIFQFLFTCVAAENIPEVRAIRKKFGPREASTAILYYEAYKKKHGHAELIDKCLQEAIPYWKAKDEETDSNEQRAIIPPSCAAMDALPKDDALVRQAVYDATKDKVTFFVEVQKLDRKRAKPDIVGDLKDVAIKDDVATGRAKITVEPQVGEGAKEPARRPPSYEKTFKFRRINGGWLMDSL